MSKKILLVLALVGLTVAGFVVFNLNKQRNTASNSPLTLNINQPIQPSQSLKEYQDQSGFTISYPDNLSIVKNDIEDDSTYADIQLTAKGVNGSLSLKITDSKYETIDDWLKLNKAAASEAPKEVKLGGLRAMEVKTIDRLLLGALDNGVFFDIEVPLVEKDFWMKVYDKVLSSFTFALPEVVNSAADSSGDISFEGEEVVE